MRWGQHAGEDYSADGKLSKISQGQFFHTLTYSDESTSAATASKVGLLIKISDERGRALELIYNNEHLLERVDFAGITRATYQYGAARWAGNRLLASVTYPDGSARNYVYKNYAPPNFEPNKPFSFFTMEQAGLKVVGSGIGASVLSMGMTDYSELGFSRYSLIGIDDENGNRFASWEYDDKGRATVSEHANGAERVGLSFAADYKSTTVTNSLGKKTIYHYEDVDGTRRMTHVEGVASANCAAANRVLSYDGAGNVASKTDWKGNVTNYTHDAKGLELSRTEIGANGEERHVSTEWYAEFQLPIKITSAGRTQEFQYDDYGNLIRLTLTDTQSGNTQETHYTYNAFGQVLSVDGPRTDVEDITQYTYDNAGNRTSITNALGHTISFYDFDALGNPLRMVDANGVETLFTYHVRGWLTSVSVVVPGTNGVEKSTTHYAYDAVGQLVGVTEPNGTAISYEYDAAHRLVAIVNNLGDRIDYTLDSEGNRTEETISDNGGNIKYVASRVYDELGRTLALTGASGNTTRFSYDKNDNLVGLTDPKLQSTSQAVDEFDQLVAVTDAALGVTQFKYDALGRVQEVKDANNNATRYVYDAFGNVIEVNSPDTGITTHTYDAANNRVSSLDARGVVTRYEYDALNRLTKLFTDAEPDAAVIYVYDELESGSNGIGRMTRMLDASGTTAFRYDFLGNLAGKTWSNGDVSLNTSYVYGVSGLLEGVTYPSGMSLFYSYDASGRVASISSQQPGGGSATIVSDIRYLPFGPLTGYTLGNGIVKQVNYDGDYRLASISESGANPVLGLNYQFDPNGNILTIGDEHTPGKTQQFDYDALDRLVAAEGEYGDIQYQYDPVGNRLERTLNTDLGSHSEDYTMLPGSNQLESVSATGSVTWSRSFQYDANGNRVKETHSDGREVESTYNAANRYQQLSVNGVPNAFYTYNGLGQRVAKSVAGVTEYFYYNESGQLIATSQADGTLTHEFVYLAGQLVALFAAAPQQFPPIAQDDVFSVVGEEPTVLLSEQLLANDTDPNGDQLSINAVTGATAGTVALDVNGNAIFTPQPGYSGLGSFAYEVVDTTGLTSQAMVTLYIGNKPPIAKADYWVVSNLEPSTRTTAQLLVNDVDPDGDTLHIVSIGTPSSGTLARSDDTLTYTPAGTSATSTSFNYSISDGKGGVATAAVELLIATIGSAGSDYMNGTSADDQLYGGAGVDTLNGGAGSDTYIWMVGDGNDVINNYDVTVGRNDVLRLIGVTVQEVHFTRNVNHLKVLLPGNAWITVNNFFNQEPGFPYAIDGVQLDDGTLWSKADILQLVQQGTSGNDKLYGYSGADSLSGEAGDDYLTGYGGEDHLAGGAGNDTLYGGDQDDVLHGEDGIDNINGDAGNDVLLGGEGNDTLNAGAGDDQLEGGPDNDTLNAGDGSDTYIWRVGDGNDTINNYDISAGRNDVLNLIGVMTEEVSFARSVNHLKVALPGNAKVTVNNFFSSEPGYPYALDGVALDGIVHWNRSDILVLVQQGTAANDQLYGYSGADTLAGGAGNDNFWGNAGDDQLQGDEGADTFYGGEGNDTLSGGADNDTLNGENGDDLLEGGAGNDSLNGGNGSDTYVWRLGDGSDTINNYDTSAGRQDRLKLHAVLVGEVSFTRSGNHLWVGLPGAGKITITNFFLSPTAYPYAVNLIELDDGTQWNIADIEALTAN